MVQKLYKTSLQFVWQQKGLLFLKTCNYLLEIAPFILKIIKDITFTVKEITRGYFKVKERKQKKIKSTSCDDRKFI